MGLGVFGRGRAPIDLLGDLLDTIYHLVDKDGQSVSPEISNLICSIGLPDLPNVFIIDDQLARALLNL